MLAAHASVHHLLKSFFRPTHGLLPKGRRALRTGNPGQSCGVLVQNVGIVGLVYIGKSQAHQFTGVVPFRLIQPTSYPRLSVVRSSAPRSRAHGILHHRPTQGPSGRTGLKDVRVRQIGDPKSSLAVGNRLRQTTFPLAHSVDRTQRRIVRYRTRVVSDGTQRTAHAYVASSAKK